MPLNPWRLQLLSRLHTLGTVRAVAEAARMSPSSVSQQLAVLESETHTPLLERVGRRVRLTPAGVLLATRATAILDQMDAVEAELAGLSTAAVGPVRVGCFPSAMRSLMIPAAACVARDHPMIALEIVELEPPLSNAAVQRGEIDIAVTADFVDGSLPIDPGVSHVPLGSDEIVLVVPASHPSVGRTVADLVEFADTRWSLDFPDTYLANLTLRSCRQAGFEPLVAGRFSSFEAQLRHVEAGLSVAMLPELAVDDRYRVATTPLPFAPRRRITAAFRSGLTARVSVARVLEELRRSALPALGGSAESGMLDG